MYGWLSHESPAQPPSNATFFRSYITSPLQADSLVNARALLDQYLAAKPTDAFAMRLHHRLLLWTPQQGAVLHEGPEVPPQASAAVRPVLATRLTPDNEP